MKKLLLFCIFGCTLMACQNGQNQEKSIEEIEAAGKISSIIRNPKSADGKVDTVNVAKIEFEEERYDFGEIDEGGVVNHVFKFKNTGKVPLVISNARSTCGCTVPQWPKDPIAPGDNGEIAVKFNTKGKKNKQSKPVTITANTYPNQTKVFINGFVHPDPNAALNAKSTDLKPSDGKNPFEK